MMMIIEKILLVIILVFVVIAIDSVYRKRRNHPKNVLRNEYNLAYYNQKVNAEKSIHQYIMQTNMTWYLKKSS